MATQVSYNKTKLLSMAHNDLGTQVPDCFFQSHPISHFERHNLTSLTSS